MLPGDTVVSKLSIAECLTAIEFALTHGKFSQSYAPYSWQVYSSDSRKGRLTAIAKARPQSDDTPSFSVSFQLKVQEGQTLVAWSYDAPNKCQECTEATNRNLSDYLNYVQAHPETLRPTASPQVNTATSPVSAKAREAITVTPIPKPMSTPSVPSGASGEVRYGATARTTDSGAAEVIPTINTSHRAASSGREPVSPSKSSLVNNSVRTSARNSTTNTPTTATHTGSVLPMGAWWRQFFLGESCPECQGMREVRGDCPNNYHD